MKTIKNPLHNAIWVSMNTALADMGNYHSDGSVNWSFVDADVYMDVMPKFEMNHSNKAFYHYFNTACDIIMDGMHMNDMEAG